MQNIQLFIIDAQNDFCDVPATAFFQPALPIPGADRDSQRLAHFIGQAQTAVSSVIATLDSHHPIDLAHSNSWRDAQGQLVDAFTEISATDVRAGRYRPVDAEIGLDESGYLLNYLDGLQRLGRTLMLWPAHCLIGSYGHNLHEAVAKALRNWEIARHKPVYFLQKGENIRTESFSALKAVIPCPGDAGTELNQQLLDTLAAQERILVAGQASSHCVRETIEDMLRYGSVDMLKKLCILTDCMSPVPGFETQARDFYNQLQAQGARLTTSVDILPELLAGTEF